MSELEKVKLWIGLEDNDDDALIELLLETAEEIIKGRTLVPKDFESLKVEAVVVAYNQRGSEGTKVGSSDGFSTSWYSDTMEQFIKNKMPARYVVS